MRPFITDDARVVGRHQAQLETWLRIDRYAFQQWALGAFGPWAPLELTFGGFHGYADSAYGAAAPVFQGKLLLHAAVPNGLPGVATIAGAVGPLGTGAFKTGGWDYFSYVAVTESLFDAERVLIHGNLGVFGSSNPEHQGLSLTWGVGTQIRLVGGMHFVGELFSGDPYVGGGAGAGHGGARYFFSDNVQVDATVGSGLWGAGSLPFWGTVGLRLVSNPLF